MHITREEINSIDFDNHFKNICCENDKNEFFGKDGTQHYRLLSYLSSQFDNSNIIDLGTHLGNSALALSYNKSNTVYTFDILDKVSNNKIKEVENIHFCMDNLFEKPVFDQWREIILSCPFIFVDVDPHNGEMEWTFYHYLKSIDYNGFVVCDDIWHFK